MTHRFRFASLLALTLLATAGLVFGIERATAHEQGDEARVIVRLAEGERIELGLRIGEETILPERRFATLLSDATPWMRSSAVELADGRDVWVLLRRGADGRFEWGLRVAGVEGELTPEERFVPQLSSYSSWAASGAIVIPAAPPPSLPLPLPVACGDGEPLRLGFFAFFDPVSYQIDDTPSEPLFFEHYGYEAALVEALETMRYTGLSFQRIPISVWPDIWLSPTTPDFDIVGGGITILESRTMDHQGRAVVAFTDGHIAFRQSLLMRAADAAQIRTHDDLTAEHRIGAVAGTTGEARLLQLTGLADENGVLAAGVRIELSDGAVIADGSTDYMISAAEQSVSLAGRVRLTLPDSGKPQVVYLGDNEADYIAALERGELDGLARGELGNRDAALAAGGALAVTALDPAVEYGGFALPVAEEALLACINERINWLTDNRRIGYAEWVEYSDIFIYRAALWNDRR